MRHLAIPAALLLLLGACGSPGDIRPRQSTSLQVRAALGPPTDIRFDRNGDELWEYARGPGGFETWLVRIGPDGKVKEATQLLTEEQLMGVSPGMTKQEVRNLLGRPSDVSFTGAGESWSWRFGLGGSQPGHLVVNFNPDHTVRDRNVIMDRGRDDDSRSSK